ncbi:outer membrane protein assembly factor BamA [Methyloligella sp. 2.7D]|uniref:outer membrane protein assembly factor BamA n=1 Tax=unclassified Methyloligella TaxID=2625955 RepID=UPI001FEFACF0|nr:outer membrane protein assembly factor BamA [Methyloligella sp. GL2]
MLKGLVFAVLTIVSAIPLSVGISLVVGDEAQAQTITSIQVQGNRRVEAATVRAYLTFSVGDTYDPAEVDESLKTLFSTGLFKDVRIRGNAGVVTIYVVENPIVNRVTFEGNKEIKDDALMAEVSLKPRTVFTQARVQADVQRIRTLYERQGMYSVSINPVVTNVANNRIDVTYQIGEGETTKVRAIHFVGNNSYSDSQLRYVISTTRTNWLSFLKNTNIYDPDRLNLDKELLRQFYLKEGYVDVQVVSAIAEVDPNKDGFVITFTIDEGARYRIGAVDIESHLPAVNVEALRGDIKTRTGKWYDASKVERTVEALTVDVSQQGYAFSQVKPRLERDPTNQIVNITYLLEQGPRVYIERIDIVGNYRTHDSVIRREFRLSEGDAYNRLLVEAARGRLRKLGFFKSVDIDTSPGSAPDRVVLTVRVEEQPTGELSFGVGYSTSEGIIGDIAISERNFMGRGQYVRLGVSGSMERSQVDFSFTEPHFLGRNLAAGFDLFHKDVDYSDVASFSQKNSGGTLRLGFPVAEDTRLGLRYSYEHEEIYDVTNNASPVIKASEGTADVSSIGYTLAYDTRNLPQSPTQGIFVSFSQDMAGLGGTVNYIRTVGDARGYYPLTKKITLAGRLQGGVIEGWGDTHCGDSLSTSDPGCLRLTDLFFKGGETIRGFERAGIGPRDLGSSNHDALGGKVYYAATAEVRFPMPLIPENLGMQGAFFVDAGSLYDASSLAKNVAVDIADGNDLRASAGFSVIWASPLGPLRADIAQAFLKTDYDETEVFRFGASTNF